MGADRDHASAAGDARRGRPRKPAWRRSVSAEQELQELRELRAGGSGVRRRRRLSRGRLLGVIAGVIAAWFVLSLALFAISNATAPGISDAAKNALDGGGMPPVSATTILVLGSDQRTASTHEPGASTSGPSRSDVMLLIRAGGGHSARLSIPRDTIVPIPGHGVAKINAAYAYGGAALAIETVKSYLGIPIDHVVQINFDGFPKLIDALGGVDYSGGCVVSRINGGFRNGGYTLSLTAGTHHLDGKAALALARTRHNLCHLSETDLDRAKRQQKLFVAMEHRLRSPSSLLRLPWIAWSAPRALSTDMGAISLIGLFAALQITGTPPTQLLAPSGTAALSDGGVGLVVSDSERRAAVARFLAG